ncbi:gliding motility-associated C-terminal domain-containing protein [Taibaiella sp. KBW10]|uniref:T9SS type B sorting domain-containing protein n=1 Tax=Taibaiella sp. KBW10 TaxID=2153357 RepID=UPI0013150AF0|nr:gliding motility-associated C-terminal domain-containing protein [Taibaiella sp. KBW10]
MKFKNYVASFAALCLLAFGTGTHAQNLVANGTFTAGTASWTFYAPGTTSETNPENLYGGALATNITGEIDNESNFRQVNIPVTPGETYHLSLRRSRRVIGGTGFALPPIPSIIRAKVYNGANLFLTQDIASSNTTWNWQCASFQFTPTTATVTLDLENVNNPSTLGCIIDDITITPVKQVITFNGHACVGGDFGLTAPGSVAPNTLYTNYSWTGPNGFTSTAQSINFTNAQTNLNGVYTCTMTLNGCLQVTGEYTIGLTTTATNDVAYICQGDSMSIFGIFRHVSGSYDSTFQNVNGCDSLSTVTLHVVPKPGSILGADSLIVCQYDTVRLETTTVPINTNFTYEWRPNIGINTNNQPNVWLIADKSIDYKLTVTGNDPNLPCSIDHTVHVIVNPGNFLKVNLTDTAICPGNKVSLLATGAQSYAWSPALYLDTVTSDHPVSSAETSMNYTLVGTSNKGCRDTQQVHITVHPEAVLNIPRSINIYGGETYQMEPLTNAVHFYWFPNSGLNSTGISNPLMSPEVNTRYFVSATTENGCSIFDSTDVYVKGTVIDMPNAFTPNNSNFKASKRGIATLNSFKVFNRWGEEVFSTTNIEQGWDGRFKGSAQAAGVYVYVVDALTQEGKVFKKQGTVTLIR